MKVLITGCHGQVGSCLVKQLNDCPDVTMAAFGHAELDITNQVKIEKTVFASKPDIIINAAAYTAVDKAEKDVEFCYAINRDGPRYLAEAAERSGAAILHISTDYVFAGDKNGAYSETDKTNPQGVYGQSKLAGEQAVIAACPRHIILRTAWVFGEQGNNFVKTMLRLAQTKDTLSVVSDQFGGPTYAGDIAQTLITIANKIVTQGQAFDNSKFGIYHFSGLPHVSWHKFAQAIFSEAVGQNFLDKAPSVNSITTADYPTPAKRPANSTLDTSRITETFEVTASDWQRALHQLTSYTD